MSPVAEKFEIFVPIYARSMLRSEKNDSTMQNTGRAQLLKKQSPRRHMIPMKYFVCC